MRITGRQLRRIIQEEVGRMMNEEDAATTPSIPGSGIPVTVQKMRLYAPASPEEAQAEFDRSIASGQSRTIPGVSAIERDASGTRAGGLAVPENFQTGVFTFNVTLASKLMGNMKMGVNVLVNKIVSAVIDGQPRREAVQAMDTNPYLDTYSKKTFEGVTGPNAKMILTVSSVSNEDDSRYSGAQVFRTVTVKSIKFTAL